MTSEKQAARLLVERLRDPEKYVDACDEAADWIERQLDQPVNLPSPWDDAPIGRCMRCNRATWMRSDIGKTCGLTQPDSSKCDGKFVYD